MNNGSLYPFLVRRFIVLNINLQVVLGHMALDELFRPVNCSLHDLTRQPMQENETNEAGEIKPVDLEASLLFVCVIGPSKHHILFDLQCSCSLSHQVL